MRFLITGGAGFIGSNLVRLLIDQCHEVCNVDALTYAGNRSSLADLEASPAYAFHKLDIAKGDGLHELVAESKPDAVLHIAAESHVDRSIDGITYVTDRPGHSMRYAIDASKLKREL